MDNKRPADRVEFTTGTRRWIRRSLFAAMLGMGIVHPARAEQASAASKPLEYSLLMPAVANKYVVITVNDLLGAFALGGHTNSLRGIALNNLVKKDGYDASLVLASVMQEELEAAGFRSEIEPVPRAPQGQPQRLTRSDLPTSPNGRYLLDVVIEQIGLANSSTGGTWQPAFKLDWRVMRPSGEIVVPTHVFWHGPSASARGGERTQTTCDMPPFNVATHKPQILWDCFDHGLREASRALIPVIREQQDIILYGKHTPATGTATGGTGMASKSSEPCTKAKRPRDILDGKCGAQ